MAPTRRGIEIPDADPTRSYSAEERQRLTVQVSGLLGAIHAGAFSERPVDKRLLQDLHAAIFGGVRGHAGRTRSRDFGQETLMFGPHYATRRTEVDAELGRVFAAADRDLRRIHELEDDDSFAEQAIQFAARLHADIIRIHPFEDGNGRTCRAIMNVVLVRLGFRPVLLEVPRQEYYAVLNHYFVERDPRPLYDLAIRLLLE